MFGHPRYRTLNRFADRELSSRRHRRVAAHLAECTRCRQEVSFIRSAGELARSLDTAKARRDLLDRVLERRATGERVLLPVESPGTQPSRSTRLMPAAAAAMVLLFVGLFARTGLLEADRGDLTIEPDRPRVGDTLSLRYDGGFEFETETYLKVRARFRTASGWDWEQIAGVMAREEDSGLFTTQVALPDSVVYAAFAVEDLTAELVDSNNRGLWDVMVHGADGRPTVDALSERYADLSARGDRIEARRTARLTIELYPDAPHGWSKLLSMQNMSGIGNDSVRAWHRERFQRLERHLQENPPQDPSALAEMAWYAASLGNAAGVEYWSRQAERRGDRSVRLYQTKAFLTGVQGRSPAEEQQELEALWQEAPSPVRALTGHGWRAAVRAGDWDAAMRWLARYRDARGYQVMPSVVHSLRSSFPADRVLDWALAGQTGPFPATHRPLRDPQSIHARRLDASRQEMLAVVADLALETGRWNVARGVALEALPLAWETRALNAIGTVLLEAGDTANAAVAFARVAADPVGTRPPDAITARQDWPELLESAEAELDRWVLRESVMEYPEIEPIAPGRPAVVVFDWSCDDVDRVHPIVDAVEDAAVVVYLVHEDGPTDDLCGDPIVPVRRDPTGHMVAEFHVRGLTSYFVLDAEGRIRFRSFEPEEIPRQLAALHTVTAPAVAP